MRALSCHVPLLSLAILLGGCGEVWNNPYPSQDGGGNILYSAFTERPKHLDPVQSYSEDEAEFNSQIYEPPLQYHYLKRPYELVPLTAEAVPRPRYVDAAGRAVAAESPKVAFSSTRSASARHPLSAASCLRPRRGWQAALSRSGPAGPAGRPFAARFPAQRHARADGRGLHLPDQAPCPSAPAFAGVRPDERVHRRPQGVRRAPEAGGRGAGAMAAGATPGWICRSSRSKACEQSTATPTASASRPLSAVRLLAGDEFLRPRAASRSTAFFAQPGMARRT
jgi:hypothetical protein